MPHDITIKIIARDAGIANAIWNRILFYRCRDSENRIINLTLGDDACWQNQLDDVMSAGFNVLYVRNQQTIYAVAVNPYLEENSFQVALNLALQAMKGQ